MKVNEKGVVTLTTDEKKLCVMSMNSAGQAAYDMIKRQLLGLLTDPALRGVDGTTALQAFLGAMEKNPLPYFDEVGLCETLAEQLKGNKS